MDITITPAGKFGGIDQRWIGGDHGFDIAESVTIDVSLLTVGGASVVDEYGQVRGGTLLGKVTATGRYGAFDLAATDGRQKIAGAITRNESTVGADGRTALSRIGAGLLRHGRIHQQYLPVTAHRTVTRDTATTADLIFD